MNRMVSGAAMACVLTAAVVWLAPRGTPSAEAHEVGSGVPESERASRPLPVPRSPCLELNRGAWTPRPGEAVAPFLILPRILMLPQEVGVDGPETGRLLVRPRQGLGSRMSWSYRLEEIDGFDMQIVFVNDVTTIHLNLYERSWGWIGDGLAETGAGGVHRRQVRLEAVPCGVPS